MAWGEAQADDTSTIPFPTSPKVYHFHPIAFVEQMRRMSADLVYKIYHTGKIVENGDYEKAKEVSFVYHDKNGGKHMLGIYTLTEVDTYSNGVKKKKLPKNVNLFDYEAKFSSVYKCDLYYKKRNGKVKTIDISEHMSGNRSGSSNVMLHFNYKSGNFKINFYAQTSRRYAKPECFAAIIGVVVDTGYSDIKINGFTSKDGTGSPSSTHPGGMKVDISNLDTETIKPTASVDTYDANYSRDRTYALCKSLITFGYKSIVTADDVNQKKNTTNIILKSDHTNHLHCQGFIRNK